MDEARFSLNIRFNYHGYDSQITMRDDENCGELINRMVTVITALEGKGVAPARRWEEAKKGDNGHNGGGNGGGNGSAAAAMAAPVLVNVKPVCKHCGTDAHMELVHFEKNGLARDEWKCQDCGKWHYDKAPR